MWVDPIVEEVRNARKQLAREAGFDLHKLCETFRAKAREHPERLVNREGRRARFETSAETGTEPLD